MVSRNLPAGGRNRRHARWVSCDPQQVAGKILQIPHWFGIRGSVIAVLVHLAVHPRETSEPPFRLLQHP